LRLTHRQLGVGGQQMMAWQLLEVDGGGGGLCEVVRAVERIWVVTR
jgi:hypothetical protein